jgi:hypothetical protein
MLTILLFVLGLSFLGKRAAQYRRTGQAVLAAQAKALAEAGLEDVLLKLERDLLFPQLSIDQQGFTYSEELTDGGVRVGSYTITLDGRYREEPYLILIVTSLGEAGDDPARPTAQRAIAAEIDLSIIERIDDNGNGVLDPNPYYRKVINFNDLGAP